MASTTKTYIYKDADGQVKPVEVTADFGECEVISTRSGSLGTRTGGTGTTESRRKITITLSIAIPVPLELLFRVNSVYSSPVDTSLTTSSEEQIFTVPKNKTKHEYTVTCKKQYANNPQKRIETFTHVFLAQDEVPTPDKKHEPEIPTEIPFNQNPLYVFEGNQSQPNTNRILPIRIEVFRRGEGDNVTSARSFYSVENRTRQVVIERNAINSKVINVAQMNVLDIEMDSREEWNVFVPVRGTFGRLNLLAEVEEQFIELFTSYDASLRLDYYLDGKLSWQGFNVAELYEESFTNAPFRVSASFSDGMGILNNTPYDAVGERKTIHQVIGEILYEKLGSDLPLFDAVYTYPVEAQMNEKRSPWEKTEVDVRVYQTIDGPDSCKVVLEKLLSPFGATLRMGHYNGQACWIIEEPGAAYANKPYRKYNTSMEWEGTVNREDVLSIDHPDVPGTSFQINTDASKKKQRKILKEVVVNKKLEFIPDLIKGGEFHYNDFDYSVLRGDQALLKDWDKTGDFISRRGINGGEKVETSRGSTAVYNANYSLIMQASNTIADAYLKDTNGQSNLDLNESYFDFSGEDGFTSTGTPVKAETGNYFDLEIAYRVTTENVGNNSPAEVLKIAINGYPFENTGFLFPVQVQLGDLYLDSNKNWQSYPVTLLLRAYTIDDFVFFEMRDIIIPNDDTLRVSMYRLAKPFLGDLGLMNLINEFQRFFVEVDHVRGIYKPQGDFATNEETIIGTITNNFARSESYKVDVVHADVPTLQNLSALTYDGVLTTLWGTAYGKTQTNELAKLLIEKILNVYGSNDKWMFQGFEIVPKLQNFSPSRLVTSKHIPSDKKARTGRGRAVQTTNAPKFFCTGASFTSRQGIWRCTWVQLSDLGVTVNYEVVENRTTSSVGRSGGGITRGSATLPVSEERQRAEAKKQAARVTEARENVVDSIPVYFDKDTETLRIDKRDLPASDGVGDGWGYRLSAVKYEAELNRLLYTSVDKEGNLQSVPFLLSGSNSLDSRYLVTDFVSRQNGGDFLNAVSVRNSFTVKGASGNSRVESTSDGTASNTYWINAGNTNTVRISSTLGQSYFNTSLAINKGSGASAEYALDVNGSTLTNLLRTQDIYFDKPVSGTQMLVVGANKLVTLQDIPSGSGTYTLPLMNASQRGGAQLNGYGLLTSNGFLRFNPGLGLLFTGTNNAQVRIDDSYVATRTWVQNNFSSGGSTYQLPTMSAIEKGGARVNGFGLTMSNDQLIVNFGTGLGLSGSQLVVNQNIIASRQWVTDNFSSGGGTIGTLDQVVFQGNSTNRPISLGGKLTLTGPTRQMLDMFSTSYGLGIQSSTLYIRTAGNFAIYRGGSHSDSALNAGGGATVISFNTNGTMTVPALGGSGTQMIVANSNGTFSRQAIPSGSTGGGVSGTAGFIPVFDASTDGVGNSWIRQDSTLGIVMGRDRLRIGTNSTTRIFIWNGTTESGTLQFESSGRMYWNRLLAAGQGLALYDMTTAPAAVSNGCVIFSQGGLLRVRNSNGTIVTLS